MAMTLQEISDILTSNGFNHSYDKEDKIIFAKGTSSGESLALFIRLNEDGEFFDMSSRLMDGDEFLNTKGTKHLQVLMAYLLQRNFDTKFGTWEYNSEDGTISFAVEIPLEDNNLTAKQLKRITGIMISAGDEAKNIKHILAKGSLPLEGDEAAKKIAELEAMLAQLQGSGI